MDSTSLLETVDLSHSFGDVHALRQVDLSLVPGNVALLGNNGAGKSTLIKILLSLIQPKQGQVRILGHDIVSGRNPVWRRIGYMPETRPLVPLLKGYEYVALSGELYGMAAKSARRRAHEILNYVGLEELRYRKLDEYSTGNVQRLKLAAALVHDPELLILDEPTGGLDPTGRTRMLRLLQDLLRSTGKSLLMCTHLFSDVEDLCQDVVILHQGRVRFYGPVSELRNRVSDRYQLGATGELDAFAEALRQTGGQVERGKTNGTLYFTVPHSWRNARFFELAESSGAVITSLKMAEEDLQASFFRLTDAEDLPAEETSTSQRAHGVFHAG